MSESAVRHRPDPTRTIEVERNPLYLHAPRDRKLLLWTIVTYARINLAMQGLYSKAMRGLPSEKDSKED